MFSSAKLVFLSVPKTGSTAYEQALAPLASMVVNAPPELKHSPVFRYNRFFRPALEKFVGTDLEVIAVMREPLDWLGSWYRFRRRPSLAGHPSSTQGIDFDEFIQAYMQGQKPAFAQVGSQAKFLEPQANGTAVTRLFKYEDQEDLQDFLKARLNSSFTTAQVNRSPKIDLRLSTKTEDRFRRKFEHEYDLWLSIGKGGSYTPLSIG